MKVTKFWKVSALGSIAFAAMITGAMAQGLSGRWVWEPAGMPGMFDMYGMPPMYGVYGMNRMYPVPVMPPAYPMPPMGGPWMWAPVGPYASPPMGGTSGMDSMPAMSSMNTPKYRSWTPPKTKQEDPAKEN